MGSDGQQLNRTDSQGTSRDDSGTATTTRRRLLATGAATWATVGLAGCTGSGDDSDGGSSGARNYVVTAETGAGSEGVPESAGFISACSASRRFVPGMQVVFYVGIFDPETGEQLTDEDLDSVVVNVDGSESVELSWAGDDEENPADEWGGSYVLSEDIEPGTYSYTVEVSNGDANYQTVGILEDSFEVIEQANPTNYVVTTETWWDNQAPEESVGFVESCGPERQFTQEMDVTFVIGVYDGSSGEIVGNDTLDSVTIESTDDSFDPVELSWNEGGEDSEPQWSGTLDTADLSPASYSYDVVVTNGDANYHDVGIASNQFTIIEL
ncbi:MAG: hypothetical protein U9O06_04545 [Euryarchaeota archaeon]|nr:hypothetical protein [Euryarchaeota archaeon]